MNHIQQCKHWRKGLRRWREGRRINESEWAKKKNSNVPAGTQQLSPLTGSWVHMPPVSWLPTFDPIWWQHKLKPLQDHGLLAGRFVRDLSDSCSDNRNEVKRVQSHELWIKFKFIGDHLRETLISERWWDEQSENLLCLSHSCRFWIYFTQWEQLIEGVDVSLIKRQITHLCGITQTHTYIHKPRRGGCC